MANLGRRRRGGGRFYVSLGNLIKIRQAPLGAEMVGLPLVITLVRPGGLGIQLYGDQADFASLEYGFERSCLLRSAGGRNLGPRC